MNFGSGRLLDFSDPAPQPFDSFPQRSGPLLDDLKLRFGGT
jgi:hypothetical protein